MLSKLIITAKENYQNVLAEFSIDESKPSPDVLYIEVEPEKTLISIDQIRSAKNFTFTQPLTMPLKRLVIKEAHLMTEEAQNSLLKLLEEPPEYLEIIILTNYEDLMLETIRSRCQISRHGQIIYSLTTVDHQKLTDFYQKLATSGVGEKIQLLVDANTREKALVICQKHQLFLRQKLLTKPDMNHAFNLKLWMAASKRITLNANPLLTLEDVVLRLKSIGLD